uniref:aminoglycoside acetyltransferase meta-AAC0020 n=1 Tax=uncultured bacterium TaxID=77133 RepID=UPI00071E9FF4|nr:Chain A, aminoglycoside acetyltransferase meta-AAC0020 [uncultured bacterium]5F46_B Chain B, aminoglycoside acetyltransferase meta-AAC0020 [uncultured bacterium]5F47_A Chain A, aminoglycoside acetyltransferase meta-AAC0020 [uncultured bacterium]5F47_B Chain B, aminoglycoside acetyltransferase meta-AAC0020 [uncultured bacterium]5F48_A Chain A, aminoglycoside acetyltransferase meta-AAC0020 [uncultured bacterium]5F48_B Chain B, aminoglycoside acetyltransferase meta-AAC0020 [uncultured bacteriu
MGQNMEIDNFLKIERLAENDLPKFIQLIRLFEAVFEMKNFSIPDSEHLQKLLNQNNFYVFVALLENKIVGGLTSYVLEQYYSEKPLAYIYDLAVDTNWQRQGIGKKLITATNQFYTEKGFEEVFVQADKVDDYALDFYRSTKPTAEEQVVHFYYTLK